MSCELQHVDSDSVAINIIPLGVVYRRNTIELSQHRWVRKERIGKKKLLSKCDTIKMHGEEALFLAACNSLE